MISEKLDKIFKNCYPEEVALVNRAFEIARESLDGKKRENGNQFLDHVIAVAEIVACEIGLMPQAISAVFLHEAHRLNSVKLDEYTKVFENEIILMAKSLNKISEINPKDTGLQADNYRKLIASYSKDPRVSLIKLADRLEIMRSLDNFSKSKQLKKATETLLLYAPLAHQLGLYNIKSEMEDLGFKYTDPEHYRFVTNKLKTGEQDRKRMTDLFVKPIEFALKKAHIKYRLKSRTKTAYSIWKKIQKQEILFESVADLFAIRIIIDSPPEREKELCWKAYSIVTEYYKPDTSRLRDWITIPKSNGYESLHTTVTTPQNSIIEIQIRTERMDDIAENGHASHWTYKGVKKEQGLEGWLTGVKALLESSDKRSASHFLDFSMDEIFVFTPDGDLRRLSAGSSILDFAFDIHTNLGLKCSGAKLNGKPCSIREKLKTGDVVEIMSTKNQKPSLDWLNFVVSSKARAKIKQKVKEEESKAAASGKELFVRRMNNWKISVEDEVVSYLVKYFKCKTIFEFYARLDSADIDISTVKSLLNERDKADSDEISKEQSQPIPEIRTVKTDTGSSDFLIIDEKLNNIDFKLSRCCNPIMGDEVFGFVTIREGIKIHRINCPNAARLMDSYPYRVQKAKWRDSSAVNNFLASIKITAYSEAGLGQQIMEIINSLNIAMRHFSISDEKGVVTAKLQILIPNNQMLDKVMFNLKKLKGIKSVSRLSNV
ncbi:MAG: hypothetical protein ACD_77C00219G0002 [uncultured bacterium]|nr:MAG: hypothetical protein ACD_77C00219G0002 [uncultured bacterium]HBY02376.1 bifunctional (p)ppGpp synthetase/guanosine-3',5'-bis(diphosphate) 3'-pyrophosphohydrolase [Rikenellaceae bacterium]